MNFSRDLSVTSDNLKELKKHTENVKDDEIDLYVWLVDGAGSYTGYGYIGSACDSHYGQKTSMTRGPSRSNAIVETAEVGKSF